MALQKYKINVILDLLLITLTNFNKILLIFTNFKILMYHY